MRFHSKCNITLENKVNESQEKSKNQENDINEMNMNFGQQNQGIYSQHEEIGMIKASKKQLKIQLLEKLKTMKSKRQS